MKKGGRLIPTVFLYAICKVIAFVTAFRVALAIIGIRGIKLYSGCYVNYNVHIRTSFFDDIPLYHIISNLSIKICVERGDLVFNAFCFRI